MKSILTHKWVFFPIIAGIIVLITTGSLIAYDSTQSYEYSEQEKNSCISDVPLLSLHKFNSIKDEKDQTEATEEKDVEGKGLSGRMVWISGGDFWMGETDAHFPDAQPQHRVHVDGFWMDQYDVTNEEYGEFIEQTGYVTVAERQDILGSFIFSPSEHNSVESSAISLWRWQKGANWRHPEGPNSDLRGREKYPVVQLAYEDAEAYANWKGRRLPTEAEWEYAARGGLDRKAYPWGDEFQPHGKFMANNWQGKFPAQNTGEDGFKGPSPVGSFPPNAFGLYDMTGNVWQWVADWYRADAYKRFAHKLARNPAGPKESLDPEDPGVKKRVLRGGSFLCAQENCAPSRTGMRAFGDISKGFPHVGFRLVQSDPNLDEPRKKPFQTVQQ